MSSSKNKPKLYCAVRLSKLEKFIVFIKTVYEVTISSAAASTLLVFIVLIVTMYVGPIEWLGDDGTLRWQIGKTLTIIMISILFSSIFFLVRLFFQEIAGDMLREIINFFNKSGQKLSDNYDKKRIKILKDQNREENIEKVLLKGD